MMNQLYFYIAAPRSGKSTISKKWERYDYFNEEHLSSLNYGLGEYGRNPRVVVNADTIRLALHGKRFDASREDEVNDYKWMMIRTYLMQGYDVLIDGTHTSHNSIWKVLSIRENATPIFLGTPMEVCLQRAYDSGQPDLAEKGVIERMFKNLEHVWRIYADPEKRECFEVDDFQEWGAIINRMSTKVMREKTESIRRAEFSKVKFAETQGISVERLDEVMKEVKDV